ncbi:MAG: carboxypeptidase-like regulatory domain-containing protein [Candidatus Zixiibacteriota bacterium]
MLIRLLIFMAIFSLTVTARSRDVPTGILDGKAINVATGEGLPAASISLVGTKLGAIADNEGRFILKNIPAGTYSIRATLIGYEDKVKSDVIIGPARPATVIMELGQATISLNISTVVTSAFFNVSNDSYTSSQSLSNEEIRRLPGSFEDVIRATSNLPGVAQVQVGRNDLIVRGGAPTENLYIIDNIEVANINHFGTQGSSGGPLSYVNLDFVDNIKL